MIINSGNLAILFRAFKASFQRAFDAAPSQWARIATRVPSTTSVNDYGWLGQIPGMREWIGDRFINNLSQHDYSIRNRSFENTVGVDRDKIDDDQYGIYAPMFEMLGQTAREHPDILVFGLLAAGGTTLCYDGQPFFSLTHPVINAAGAVANVANMIAGANTAWYLLDTRRPLKPLIFQDRKAANFVSLQDEKDENVFFRKEYIYGVDMRCNVGFGFWQMALRSQAALDAPGFAAAKLALSSMTKDYGQPLGVQPNLLVCGPSNEAAAKAVLNAEYLIGGGSNINYKAVDLLVVPWLP
ncbi:MAG: Mu-like prophage major head subunit gpT [Desulfatitalea sp. BRH_c12]|nr:MAG: Mu-like prophage major head subunit gpT [Desulfatitalea sp. BRH_c12]